MEILKRILRWGQRLALRLASAFWAPAAPGEIRRIVVVEMTRLGDLVAATALIAPLKGAFPRAGLEFWGDQAYAPLFEKDSRLSFQGLAPRGTAFLRQAWSLRKSLRGQGLLFISASPASRNSLLALLSRPSQAAGYLFQRPGGLGYDEAQPVQALGRPPFQGGDSGPQDHLVRRALKILDALEIKAEGAPSLLASGPRQPRLAVFHAGANWAWRRWPLARFRELEKRLKAQGWAVELIAAEADTSAPRPSLAALKDLLSRASLFVGNDSGPLHLAAALGVPCLGLFGPNLPSRSGPWGSGHRTLKGEVPCSPCAQTHCLQPHDWCMERISVDSVEAEIKIMEKQA